MTDNKREPKVHPEPGVEEIAEDILEGMHIVYGDKMREFVVSILTKYGERRYSAGRSIGYREGQVNAICSGAVADAWKRTCNEATDAARAEALEEAADEVRFYVFKHGLSVDLLGITDEIRKLKDDK